MTTTDVHIPAVTAPEPHFVWPVVDEATLEAVRAQLVESVSVYDRSGVVARVEDALARWHGVRHAVLMSSGTCALHAAYVAAGVGPGDEVIVPAYTFFATASPLLQTGATPVLVDCDERGNLDPARVADAVTSATRAIVVTHMWGLPADVAALRAIADTRGLLLVEDTSHAFGASVDGRPVGAFGDLAAQSLQGQKPLTGGEGGVLLTDDDELYYRGVAIAHYNVRCKREIPATHPLARYAVTGLGLKWRIHPAAAAMVEQQLGVHDAVRSGRDACAARMAARIRRLPGVEVLLPREGEQGSWYALVLRLDDALLAHVDADTLVERLHREGAVEVDRPGSTRPLAQLPLFQDPGGALPAYAGRSGARPEDYPAANDFFDRTLKLPVWHRAADMPVVDQYLDAFDKVWAELGL